MRQVIESLLNYTLQKSENFSGGAMEKLSSNTKIIATIISFVVVQVTLLFLGKWLWNEYLVKAVTIVKPLESIWQILGVSVLLKLILSS